MLPIRNSKIALSAPRSALTCNPNGVLKPTKTPNLSGVLTVNGKAAAVVQDAEAYQRLLDATASADAREGIRQGVEDVRKGRVRPAKEFFEEFGVRHGLSG